MSALKEKIAMSRLKQQLSRGIITQEEYELCLKFGTANVQQAIQAMKKLKSVLATPAATPVDHTDRIDTERVKKKRLLEQQNSR